MKSTKLEFARTDLADFHRQVELDDMMHVVGVALLDAIDVDGGKFYVRARANCRSCACKFVCRDWLVEHSDGGPQDFCPNANFFRALKNADG